MAYFDHPGPNGDTRLHYTMCGSGPPLLFLHNGFYSSISWTGLFDELSRHFCCIAWDRTGYGQSIRDQAPDASLASGAAELDSLLAHIENQGHPSTAIHLWGHCMGAAIAVDWVSRHPGRTTSLTLEACGFFTDQEILRRVDLVSRPWEKLPRSLRKTMETMHGPDRAALVWSFIINHSSSYVMEPGYDLRPQLSSIDCPTLVCNGDRDLYFSRDHAREGAALISQSQLWLPDDCGHDMHMELGNEIVREFHKFAAVDSLRPI